MARVVVVGGWIGGPEIEARVEGIGGAATSRRRRAPTTPAVAELLRRR